MNNICDWERIKEHFEAFWQGEIIDRCCFAVTAPRKEPLIHRTEYVEPQSLNDKWFNPEIRHRNFLYKLSTIYHGGDSFPNFWANMGPGVVAAYVGSPHTPDESTIWFDRAPILKEWVDLETIRFDENGGMWKSTSALMEYFCRNASNKYFVSMTDLGGTLDIIASLRGSEQLLMDLYDYPDELERLIEKIDQVWLYSYEKLQDLTNRYLQGSCGWLPVWCNDKTYPIQCDISVMISPAQFEKYALPSLIRQSKYLDKCIYHLDGPGELAHLDMILELESIHAIEWVPIPENGRWTTGDEKWFSLYRKIQDKGKKLILRSVAPESIEKLLENISPKGLFFSVQAQSEEEALEIEKKVAKWSARKN